jgi:hypothetical protein
LSTFESAQSGKFDGWTVGNQLSFAYFADRQIDDQLAELVGIAGPFGALDHAPIMADGPGNSKVSIFVTYRHKSN